MAVAGVAGSPEPSLTETRHSASSASTPNFEPPVRVWERVPSGEEHLPSPFHPVCSRRCARGVGGHARRARARADARPCAVEALGGASFMDEDISVVAALEISPAHKRVHAANARASPPRASPGRAGRAGAAQRLRWDADSGGRSPPAGRPSPRARVDEVFLSDSEVPPPSLPYKVDTSRPSLRTNWTRLVVARRRRRPPRCPARARLRAPRVAAAPAPVGGDGGGGGGEGRGAAYLREQRAATGRRRRAGPVGPGGGPVGPGGRAGCRGCAARALGRRGRARGARPGAAGAAEGLGRAESAGRGRRARAGPRRGGGRFGAAVGTYHVAAHGGVSRAVRTREGAEGWRPGVQKGSPRAAPLRQAKAFALTAGALRRHSPSASWPPPASTSCSRCTSSPEGRGVSD